MSVSSGFYTDSSGDIRNLTTGGITYTLEEAIKLAKGCMPFSGFMYGGDGEIVNIDSIGGGGSGTGDVSKAYVDSQDEAVLNKVFEDLAGVATTGDYEDLLNKPTTMEADGGNSDTVDDKHASDFLGNTDFVYNWKNGNNTVSLNDFKTEYHAFVFNVLDRPSGCNYGFLDVSKFDGYGFAPATSGVIRQQWTDYDTSTVYSRVFKNDVWTDWVSDNSKFETTFAEGTTYEAGKGNYVAGDLFICWGRTQLESDGEVTVTFPYTYAHPPVVSATYETPPGTENPIALHGIDKVSCTFMTNYTPSVATYVNWIAVGKLA